MIRGIQVIGVLVGIYLMLQTLVQWKRGNYGVRKTVLWLSLWTLIAILFAFPGLTSLALPILSMENTILMVVVVGLIVAYALVYETYQQAARAEKKLTELAQNIAIHDYFEKARGNPDEKDEER